MRRRPSTLVRTLAIHYLSRPGGGIRSVGGAAALYRTDIEAAAEAEADAGRDMEIDWQALPDWWAVEFDRVLRELEGVCGPL